MARASTFLAKSLSDRSKLSRRLRAFALLACCAGSAFAQGDWMPLRKDGIHDPRGPAIKQLQPPQEALAKLPRDTAGNLVNWIEAFRSGAISPRPSLAPGVKPEIRDDDILLNLRGSMPIVLFSHKKHTEWLDCANCHKGLFQEQKGATQISMFQILAGEQCGVCHGAVSFPLTECSRCHSVLRPGQTKPVFPLEMPQSHGLPRAK